MSLKSVAALALLFALLAGGVFLFLQSRPEVFRQDTALQKTLDGITDDYRKIIVLVDGSETLDEAARTRAIAAGRLLFWRKHQALDDLTARLQQSPGGIKQLIHYLTQDRTLHDADKLAFQDVVDDLDSSPPAAARGRRNALAASLRALHDNLESIQLTYREEVTRIFSQFATRGGSAKREKWDAYIADLRKHLSREQILRELGDALPEELPETVATRGLSGTNEIFGNKFAPKEVALTFDDGPHPRYTEQVLALLRKYGLKACFFELGSHLGTVDANGQVTLARTAALAQKVLDDGDVIADHSYSHPVLTKLSEQDRTGEIDRTALLLEKVAGRKPELFRAPYGARNKQILDQVTAEGMRSVMWTIDSLDWADPVPESIVMRVLHQLNEQHKGIILFHDIHKQSVMALSPVIEELLRQNYTFLEYRDGQFVKTSAPQVTERSTPAAPTLTAVSDPGKKLYRESWAVIVGINDYQNWPKLRYAVNDANAIEETLVTKFGFKHENIRKLLNGDATRQHIMEVLGDEFTDSRKVSREDRVFFFFAGHGATRTFEDGRQLGFIVPVDADRENYYSTAISMSSLREASDLIAAKHIYFVMDSCYSGLALSRGSGLFAGDRSYLEEVTRRTARQILTAGGADQQVADDGPNGHSVFTWALLQGLDGQADLDGNGVITASELGAYVSPIVAQFAKQTPTVGNLMGSEGGEFIFELKPQALSSSTEQLDAQSLKLSAKLDSLEKEIGARQAELLKLQQSIQAESAKLAQMGKPVVSPVAVTRAAQPVRTKSRSAQAYDLDRQGQQLYREKKYAEAEQKFKAAVELKPNDAVLLNNLGFLYYVMGRYGDALTYLQKTLTIDPKRKEAHENIAELYYKMGRKAEAKAHYEQYLALYPNSPKSAEFKKILAELD